VRNNLKAIPKEAVIRRMNMKIPLKNQRKEEWTTQK
jgi:hypothetical protein